MKRMVTTKKERAAKFLSMCNPESVDYVKEFIDDINNLTVLESTGYDFVEADPSEEIANMQLKRVMFGIDEGLIDDVEQFESIYEALCIVEGIDDMEHEE